MLTRRPCELAEHGNHILFESLPHDHTSYLLVLSIKEWEEGKREIEVEMAALTC